MQDKQLNKEKKNSVILKFELGNKSVIWISEINKYILAEPIASEIFLQIHDGKTLEEIVRDCSVQYQLKKKEAEILVNNIQAEIEKLMKRKPEQLNAIRERQNLSEAKPYSKKYYRINNITFLAEFQTTRVEHLNHPKFAHMEIPPSKSVDHHFQVFDKGKEISLWVDGKSAGEWKIADSHFLSGKFSMQIIQKIYNREENRWMGVFHAAGVSNGKKCMMFYGDSGNGKSTLSALLMAAGFDILSDDFLPLESETGKVFRFPAALSIKKQAYDLLISLFPDLKNAEEYVNPALQKTFRYLIPKKGMLTGVPCVALVFVKYDMNVDFQMEEMKPEDAFIKLVPDSWIHPSEQNAKRFMVWFSGMNFYQLTYSNNSKMISTIKNMLASL